MPSPHTSTESALRAAPEACVSELASLLEELVGGESTAKDRSLGIRPFDENRLVQVRLGIASGLYSALRVKDPATAQHSLRVALTCSAWAAWLQLGPELTDALEVASLLHDVGKIGVPDAVLRKPSALDSTETSMMEGHRAAGAEILASCCARPEVLQIIAHASAWYDGSRPGKGPAGTDIPFGARMLAIIDAYDAMLSTQIYRRALPRERALLELQRGAGRQFDPELVRRFTEYEDSDVAKSPAVVARQWLTTLDPEVVNAGWRRNENVGRHSRDDRTLFRRRLLENMRDAVVFVNPNLQILGWNAGAERLTGISAASTCQLNWMPSIVQMRSERGQEITTSDCPLAYAIHSRTSKLRRVRIRGRERELVMVDAHAVPVLAEDGGVRGAMLIMRDVSQENSLEERCQDLHELATKDPLTDLANRAEFDRVLEIFVEAHVERSQPCSLIICDIDGFKQVNDNFGHQAGDDVIRSFGQVLRSNSRPGDLAARYGGEEFVLLCAGCDTATAAARAETLREAIAEISQPVLDGDAVTVSFGVTSIQAGDTPDTMLRRADRALLLAKDRGRNRVVQLGTGVQPEACGPWRWWRRRRKDEFDGRFHVKRLTTDVPLSVAVEKLRGFIADHHAEVVSIDNSTVHIHLAEDNGTAFRRASDRGVKFTMELQFTVLEPATRDRPGGTKTEIRVTINPQRGRDRRRSDVADRARRLLASLRAYLMATVEDEPNDSESKGVIRLARNVFTPLLRKRRN